MHAVGGDYTFHILRRTDDGLDDTNTPSAKFCRGVKMKNVVVLSNKRSRYLYQHDLTVHYLFLSVSVLCSLTAEVHSY